MKSSFLLLVLLITIPFVSCDETDPIQDKPDIQVDPWTAKHVTNIIIEDYTATWCGYCPRIHYAIEDVTEASSKVKAMVIYDDSDKRYPFSTQMINRFNVVGFPTAKVNRIFNWAYPEKMSGLENYLSKKQPLGLAIESTVDGTTIAIKVKVEYVKTLTTSHRIVVCVTESNLIGPQANYYNDGRGNPILDFEHNHVLRKATTDIFGDEIALASTVKDNISEHTYTFTSSYNYHNCNIVAFVLDPIGAVVNAQSVKPGENIEFEYL